MKVMVWILLLAPEIRIVSLVVYPRLTRAAQSPHTRYTLKPGCDRHEVLACAVYSGESFIHAIQWDIAAGALSATKEGAHNSMPFIRELNNVLASL